MGFPSRLCLKTRIGEGDIALEAEKNGFGSVFKLVLPRMKTIWRGEKWDRMLQMELPSSLKNLTPPKNLQTFRAHNGKNKTAVEANK